PLSTRWLHRFGNKLVVVFGMLVVTGTLLAMSSFQTNSSVFHVIAITSFLGFGMAHVMPAATESIMGSLPREKAGVGSAMNDTTRQVGGALGVAVIGSVVASVYSANIASVAPSAGLTGTALETSKGSLGGALDTAGSLGAGA